MMAAQTDPRAGEKIGLRAGGGGIFEPIFQRLPPLHHGLPSLPAYYACGGSERAPGGGGSVGTPTYIPQNDTHGTLLILNIHK